MFDGKFRQQFFESFAPFAFFRHCDLEDRHNVVFGGHAAKDRHFLWQIPDPKLGAPVHWQGSDIASVDDDFAAFWRHEARDGIKARRFARSVGPKKRHNFTTPKFKRDVSNDDFLAVAFAQLDDF